ncbi:MAG: CRISPR-associated endonuclease Cas2 [Patescibacteria group bacterium]
MNKDSDNEIVKLTAKKLLLVVLKLGTPFFRSSSIYRHSAVSLLGEIDCAQQELENKIRYLKSTGYIKTFSENKEEYIELTRKGLDRVNKISHERMTIDRQKIWDGKWRIVIYDIPKDKSSERDQLRRFLTRSGFLKIQESVYVFPFPCTEEIEWIVNEFGIKGYVEIFIAIAVVAEDKLIKKFIDKNVLSKVDIQNI